MSPLVVSHDRQYVTQALFAWEKVLSGRREISIRTVGREFRGGKKEGVDENKYGDRGNMNKGKLIAWGVGKQSRL